MSSEDPEESARLKEIPGTLEWWMGDQQRPLPAKDTPGSPEWWVEEGERIRNVPALKLCRDRIIPQRESPTIRFRREKTNE